MAEKLCELRKKGGGGGKYTETSLWTNSAPTSTFGAQAVTLSQSMADFKYLKIKVAPSTTSTSGQYFEDIVLVSELQRTTSSIQEGVRDRLVLGFARTTYDYERPYYYATNTSIYFMATVQAGTSTTSNNRIIPIEILGLNELAHGTRLSPTFELTSTGLSQSSAYGTNVASNDDTLMTNGQKQSTSTGSITVKRNAKGKIFFNYNSRGSVVTAGSVTFGGNTYSPSSLSGSSVDVEFSANDTINYTCPTGTYFASMCITFMETR